MKLSHRWSTALVALVMLCTPALARAELSGGPTIPQPPPTFAERERVLWSAPGGAWLQLVSLAIARYELRYLEWSSAQVRYVANTVAFTAPLPAGHTPVSLNASHREPGSLPLSTARVTSCM